MVCIGGRGVGFDSLRDCLAPAFVLLALSGCVARRPPGPGPTPAPRAVLEQQAVEQCRERHPGRELPPHPFTTDACTLWPDGDWAVCCVEHDIAYWCGGSADERDAADARLRACVDERAAAWFAGFTYLGVRAGGVSWLPTPWRWGYGWPWLGAP